MHTVHTTVICEALQIDIFTFILQPAAHWLLMAHFQWVVTWVGLELDVVGVTRGGGVNKGGGVTRWGGITRGDRKVRRGGMGVGSRGVLGARTP